MGVTSSFLKLLSSDKNIDKTKQTIKNSEEKDKYELDKHEVSKPRFFFFCKQQLHGYIRLFNRFV